MKVAGLAITGAALTACGSLLAKPTAPMGKPVQLVHQDWSSDWFPPMVQQMLEEFHATHPTIRVYYTPDPLGVEEKMLVDMQAGTAADVFQGCCAHFPIWAQRRSEHGTLPPALRADGPGDGGFYARAPRPTRPRWTRARRLF